MPVMDGEELVARLQQDERLRSVPVIVISTDSTAQRMNRLREMGVRGYLCKPFTPEKLREVLCRTVPGWCPSGSEEVEE
jgi:two-component system chemotaxis response regulator CheY